MGRTSFGCAFMVCLCSVTAFCGQGTERVKFRDCSITCIQDAESAMPSELFKDGVTGQAARPGVKYRASVNVFLIEKQKRLFLVDAGNDQKQGSLKAKLDALKVSPDSIEGVFITHMHPDHVGGLLWNGRPLFPKAKLYIAREEHDAWRKDARRASLAQYLEPYKGRMELFSYGKALPGGLMPIKREGHTPGHTVFRLEVQKGTYALFAGDFLHAVDLQAPQPGYCASFDSDPAKAVASRLRVLNSADIIFGAHLPFPGYGRMTAEAARGFKYSPGAGKPASPQQ